MMKIDSYRLRRLSEYSDDELIEEIKRRDIEIKLDKMYVPNVKNPQIKIGGVLFDLQK